MRLTKPRQVQDPVRNYIPPAALERAAAELAGLLAGDFHPKLFPEVQKHDEAKDS